MNASSASAELESADRELSIDVPNIQIGGRIFKAISSLSALCIVLVLLP
jgi:hypothetical protein